MTTFQERLKSRISNYRELFKKNSQRFLLPMILSLVLWTLISYIILWPGAGDVAWYTKVSLALGLTLNYSVVLQLALERCKLDQSNKYHWLQSSCLVVFIAAYYLRAWLQPVVYYFTALSGFNVMLAFLGYYFLLSQTNRKNIFPNVVGNLSFGIFAGILSMAGISLCLGAFKVLIFSGLDMKWFLIGCNFAMIVISFNAVIMQLPRFDEIIATPKFCKNLVMKIILATYLFLIMVLYLYIGKIFTYGKMPEGTMNWYASTALLFFLFFTWCLEDVEKNAVVNVFVKYGGYAMIPIVLVQLWGVWIRYQAYGVTTLRYVSLACSIFGVLAMTYTILHKYNRNLFLVGAVLAVLITVTPLNCIDMPFREQWSRIQAIVQKHNLLQDGKIVKAAEGLTDREQEIMASALDYLQKSPSTLTKNEEIKIVLGKDTKKILGIKEKKIWQQSVRLRSTNDATHAGVDIQGYTRMYSFNKAASSKDRGITLIPVLGKDEKTYYDTTPYINQLRDRALVIEMENRKIREANKMNHDLLPGTSSDKTKEKKQMKEKLEYQINPQTKVVFNEITFTHIDDDEEFSWYGNGYVLIR